MQINKQDLIILLALVGLVSFFYGEHIFELAGPGRLSFIAIVLGLGLCSCSLVLSCGVANKKIKFYRIPLTAIIGVGIISIGFAGMEMKEGGALAVLYYATVLTGIIILCFSLWLGYREFGSCDIRLRE